MSRYVSSLPVGHWVFIEIFALNYASGQFRPTSHLYKMTFTNGTHVFPCDPVSDSSYLSLASFNRIQNGDLNPYILVGKYLFYLKILHKSIYSLQTEHDIFLSLFFFYRCYWPDCYDWRVVNS